LLLATLDSNKTGISLQPSSLLLYSVRIILQKIFVFFALGDLVYLVGLESIPSLNGATGTVRGDGEYKSRGKYCIQMKRPGSAVASHLK
jgi:hypothetical protein